MQYIADSLSVSLCLSLSLTHTRTTHTHTHARPQTLERSYLLRVNGRVVERPQHMLMRVAVGIHQRDIDAAVQTYNLLSERWFTHASPTLFNAGTPRPQLSSCFLVRSDDCAAVQYSAISLSLCSTLRCCSHLFARLLATVWQGLVADVPVCPPPFERGPQVCMKEDSIEGIYDTLKECACISKTAGGIGLSIHNIRAVGSYIRGTNGNSNGIVPMLRVFNDTARYVDQGGGKRKGASVVAGFLASLNYGVGGGR